MTENKQIQHIEEILVNQQAVLFKRDSMKFCLLDDEFHRYFYQMTKREKIWNWMSLNNAHLTRFRWLRLDVLTLTMG